MSDYERMKGMLTQAGLWELEQELQKRRVYISEMHDAYFVLEWGDGKKQTFPNNEYGRQEALNWHKSVLYEWLKRIL